MLGIGEGAILPVIPLTARDMGASVPMTALLVTLIGIGSLVSNIPTSLLTMHRGECWTIVAGAIWCAIAMALCGWSGHLGLFAISSFMIGMAQAIFLLSLLAATLTLGAGIAVTGLASFLAAGHLAYWIPRAKTRAPQAER